MHAPVQQLLQPGEEIVTSVYAQSIPRFWILGVQLFAVQMLLLREGLELKSWALGLGVGLYFVLTVRFFFIYLTDSRVIIVLLGRLSTKRWTFDGEIAVTKLESIAYEEKMFQDRIAIVPEGGKPRRYLVVSGWEEEARRLSSPRRIDPV